MNLIKNNMEQINETIASYNKLISLAETKIKILETLNSKKYNNCRGIERITFEEDLVQVVVDDSFRGYSSYEDFSFPIEWLSKTDGELAVLVQEEKRLEEEQILKIKKEKEDFDKLQNEKKEIELYHKLRNKYKDSVEATIHEGISGIE